MPMMPTLYIFLDIDGVMNAGRDDGWIDQACAHNLDRALTYLSQAFDIKIIISSAWRLKYSVRSIQFRMRSAKFSHYDSVIASTDTRQRDRQKAINKFVHEHRSAIDNWIAIDDRPMPNVVSKIKTDWYSGFTESDGRNLVRMAVDLEEERRRER